jgi:hypothetical protein
MFDEEQMFPIASGFFVDFYHRVWGAGQRAVAVAVALSLYQNTPGYQRIGIVLGVTYLPPIGHDTICYAQELDRLQSFWNSVGHV